MSKSLCAVSFAFASALSTVGCQATGDRDSNAQATVASHAARVPTPASVQPMASVSGRTNTFHWQCNEISVASIYANDSAHVTLEFSGRRLTLPIAISASGARYADAAGNEFWTKGDSGTLTLVEGMGEMGARTCRLTGQPSSWYKAAERGVVFRAGGGEPGWFVEVGRGENPALRATLDYGERKIKVMRTERLDGEKSGFTGKTVTGTKIVLLIEPSACQNDMSGAWFEATARLAVGARIYTGCGAFLE